MKESERKREDCGPTLSQDVLAGGAQRQRWQRPKNSRRVRNGHSVVDGRSCPRSPGPRRWPLSASAELVKLAHASRVFRDRTETTSFVGAIELSGRVASELNRQSVHRKVESATAAQVITATTVGRGLLAGGVSQPCGQVSVQYWCKSCTVLYSRYCTVGRYCTVL